MPILAATCVAAPDDSQPNSDSSDPTSEKHAFPLLARASMSGTGANQCHSWTCPGCAQTWISVVGPIKHCERCGQERGRNRQDYQRSYWRRRRAREKLNTMSSDGSEILPPVDLRPQVVRPRDESLPRSEASSVRSDR